MSKCEEGCKELEKRVSKLEKNSKSQDRQEKLNKLLAKIIFWGAVASGFNAIVQVVSMITSWIEKVRR